MKDKQMEEGVIGALLLYPHILTTIAPILKDEYLYHLNTKIVYKSIIALFNKSEPIDVISVISDLKKNGQLDLVGGAYAVSSLTNKGDLAITSIERSCRLIHQGYILRQLTVLGAEIQNASESVSADCFEILERINKRCSELGSIRTEKIKSVGDYFVEMVAEINNVLDNGLPTGLMSGLENLDSQTGGWQNGNLIVIAARPGMGKTALSLHLAKYPALELNAPTAFFSMEMTALELTARMAAAESSLSNTKIIQKKINRLELSNMGASCTKLLDCPCYIDDTPGLSIDDLVARAKKMYYEKKLKLIVVDYLQLMKSESKNREQEISEISRGLKGLAKELNIPVIALSQLSRECEKRADKRPILSDLRESGAIEQDADIVGFIFRPAEYGLFPNGYEYKNQVLDTANLMLFDIAKGRGLRTGELPLKFYGEFMQVHNYRINSQSESMTPITNNNDFLPY